MAMNKFLFETKTPFSADSHYPLVGSGIQLPNQIIPDPGKQPDKLSETTSADGENGGPKLLPGFYQKGSIDHIINKLREMEIPGKVHVEHFLQDQYRRNYRLSSINNNLAAITSFLKLTKQNGKHNLEEITRDDLAAFIEHEQDRGLKASTVKNRLDTLKPFIRQQIENGIISSEVLQKRMIIKVPDSLPKAIEMEDEVKLLSVIDNVRDRALILLLLRTGMRIGELLNTQIKDINLKDRKIDIWAAQKTRIGRVVYFSNDALDALKAWYQKRDPQKALVFYACSRESMSYAAARLRFLKYLQKAGLSHKNYTLHCLRHTNASSLLNAGMPLECLRELLGHNSVEVTRRYAKLTNKTRMVEYFKAMAKIEKGEIDGYYKLDLELQEINEKKELLSTNSEKLYEQS
jgi:integrase/recombinase XerD